MKLKISVNPTSLPVSVEEAKIFYRIIGNDEDELIYQTIETATAKAEQITNRQLSLATHKGYLNAFETYVTIPKPPLVSVVSVEYIDVNGATKQWTDFSVEDVSEPAQITFWSLPSDVRSDDVNNVIITFQCGYVSVPSALKSWILIYGLTLFENRENIVIGSIVNDTMRGYTDRLLDDYRIVPL